MSLEHAILGLLSWRSLSGYDLKKVFERSPALYWSGNNNQIYRTLVNLHREDLVTMEVFNQESGPSRKIYTITDRGVDELKKWVLSTPELPQLRHVFLIQLSWADQLSSTELDELLARYEEEVTAQWLMLRAHKEQGNMMYNSIAQARTPREAFLWEMIQQNQIGFYELELQWVQKMRKELKERGFTE